jgi:hypothetical protein
MSYRYKSSAGTSKGRSLSGFMLTFSSIVVLLDDSTHINRSIGYLYELTLCSN